MGALLDIRNNAISSLIGGNGDPGALNTLAKGFASRVNDLFASGATAAGSLGVPLFTFDSSDDSNVARTLSVDNSVTPDQLALATTGVAAQSNGVANQLAALAGSSNAADQIAGHSALDFFSSIPPGVGQKLSDAQTDSTVSQSALTSAQANRQAQTGVSLDQEAVSITAYQRAYQASAKLISILDELTNDEVNLIK